MVPLTRSIRIAAGVWPAVRAWPISSQQGSRRNAMLASTALTQRRIERAEVEEYLAGRRPVAPPVALSIPLSGEAAAHG